VEEAVMVSIFRVVIGIAVAGLAVAAAAQAQAPLAAQGTWTLKAPMPVALSEVSAAVVAGKLYAIGGSIVGTAVPLAMEYDPATDKWRSRLPMPVARDHLAVATANGKIYTFGGFTHAVHQGASTDGQ
jgi:N-acetylneuraminic acid mutarotase